MLSLYTLLALPVLAAVLGSALVSLALCLHDLLRRRHSLPSLHFRESALNSRLLARCGLRQRVFSPSCWLSSPHVQTVLAACWPRGGDGHEVTFQREYLQMRDKGVVALDWIVSVQPRVKRKATVLLVIPPVTGDAHTVSALCQLATKRGFRTVVFNRRGHGGSVLTTAKMLSSADPSDLRQVIKYLRLRFPKSRLAAVAQGTGCGLLISYLGEFGSSAILSAGACVSPCYDTVEKFSGPLRSLYDLVHLLKLKWVLLQHAQAMSAVLDVKRALLKAWSFRAYEEAVYCRMYNYASRTDSTSRGTQSAVAVNANGVAASSSSANAASSSCPGPSGPDGGPHCDHVAGSGGLAHSAGAVNGSVVVDTSEAVLRTRSVVASQSGPSSPLLSQSASSSPPSSTPACQSTSPTVSRSASAMTSSSLSPSVTTSVTEVLEETPSAGSQTRATTSSLDSTSESTSTSECCSKTAVTSRASPVSVPQSTCSSQTAPKTSPASSASQPTPVSPDPTSSVSQVTSAPADVATSSPPSLSKSTSASPSTTSLSPASQQPPPSQSNSHYPPSSPLSLPPPSPSSGGPSQGGLEEYWERNNPIRDVDDIAVPVLCINSLDDPFFVSSSGSSSSSTSSSTSSSSTSSSSSTTIPYDLFRYYPNFLLVVTEKGGHCGFLERYPFSSWADSLCLDYLEAVFELTTRGYATTTTSGCSSASSSNSRRNTRSTI